MGIAFGLVSYLWLGFVFKDPVIEITMTFSVSYLAYFMVCNMLPHKLTNLHLLILILLNFDADICMYVLIVSRNC